MKLTENNKIIIKEFLEKYKLLKQENCFIKNSENCINTEFMEIKNKEISKGTSILGGIPHLPKNFKWLTQNKKYYGEESNELTFADKESIYYKVTYSPYFQFIAQINLKDLKKFDLEGLLPNSGILYLFFNQRNMEYQEDDYKKSFKILYYDLPESELEFTEPPENLFPKEMPELIKNEKKETYKISFKSGIKIAELEQIDDITEDETENYIKMVEEMSSKNLIGKLILLGGKKYFDSMYGNDIRENHNEKEIVLARLPDNLLGYQWGGHLESLLLWVKKEDLINKQFNKIKIDIISDEY